MAYENGIISVKTEGGVTYGVTIEDMQDAIGVSGYGDMGGILLYATARDMVNVWAKYKPVRSNKLGELTEAERKDLLFGLYIPVCSNNGNLADFLLAYPQGYTYIWPRGIHGTSYNQTNIDEWFRFLDFNGYNRNANCFVNSNDILFPSSYTVGGGGAGLHFQLGINRGSSLHTGAIDIDDLKYGTGTFGDLFFGLIFVSDGTRKIITSGNPLRTDVSTYGHGDAFLAESNGALDGIVNSTEYDVYPVLSRTAHTSTASWSNNDEVVALPISPFTFKTSTLPTEQNISINAAGASMDNGSLLVSIVISMAASGTAPTSMIASCQVFTASESYDRTGTQIGQTKNVSLDTSHSQNVTFQRQMSNPGWVRIYVYNQQNPSVNAEAWTRVRTGGELDPIDPTPVD